MSRAAVVVNPTKLDDDEAFRKSVRRVMDDHGWDEPLWLETTPEDPGRGQAESAVSAGVGLVLAIPLIWLAGQLLQSQLYRVKTFDPLTLCAVAMVIGVATLIATWRPARRAEHADPMQALRAE